MSYEAYYVDQVIGSCEWYFGRKVRLIMFKKGLTTHCLVVPAQSTLRSCAQSGTDGDILISSAAVVRPIFTLFSKIQALIADVYTVGERGTYAADETKIPPECLLPDHTNLSQERAGASVSTHVDQDWAAMTRSVDATTDQSQLLS